jgi:valyl-tRNA synthetase
LRSEEDGKLWYLKYPLKDSSGFISVATTRPETILGDVAVAVNPKDPRYRNLVGKKAILPIIGRELPIIGDEFVDPSFGSGAVKITPAHDLADFEVAQRHDLDPVFVMDEKGVMNENAGEFKGLDRFQARIKILERFKKLGLYQREEDYKVPLSRCYRCNTIIEPYLSEQWFVRTKPLARPAIDAVEGGDVRFIPQRWAKVYLEWLYGAKDWCISRQIWWGHRIPAWYCNCGRVVVEIDPPSRCPDCRGNLRQDEDVLDTWFSSALWPFATLGWPEETEDLSRFYPTSVLVTARDIIYLWVARMIMTGLEFCGEKPFAEVFINPTVQNPQGRRMSKSLGTGIDPIHLVEQYGADAVRFSLASQVSHLQDIRFSEQKIRDARNFMTKIWNAARFVYTNARVEPILPKKKSLRWRIDGSWAGSPV